MFDQMVFESGRQVSFNFDEAVGKGFSSVFCRRANLMQSWLLVLGKVYWSTPKVKVEKTEKKKTIPFLLKQGEPRRVCWSRGFLSPVTR